METTYIRADDELPKNFTGIAIYPNETKAWYKNGNPHRLDGVAVEYGWGDVAWYLWGRI
jgi:hypothetical protein